MSWLSEAELHTWQSSTTRALKLAPSAIGCSATCSTLAPLGCLDRHLFSASPSAQQRCQWQLQLHCSHPEERPGMKVPSPS